MNIITLDWETFYSKEYSLSKMSTEAYVRSPLFEAIGFSYKINDEASQWVSGSVGFMKWRLQQLELDKNAVLCHNAMFDVTILNWIFGIIPRVILDTLSMARPLHGLGVGGSLKKLADYYNIGVKGTAVIHAMGKRRGDFTADELDDYGQYCCNDCDLTYALFNILKRGFPKEELALIDQTIRMFSEPVLELDVGLLNKHADEVRERQLALLRSIIADIPGEDLAEGLSNSLGMEAAVRKVLSSNLKLAKLLKSLGVDPPMKTSATTKLPAYAFSKTDKEFIALQEHEDERVQAVVAARLGTKSTIEETRTQSFIGIAGRGKLPVPLSYAGAIVTSRWSGTDRINLQNIPPKGAMARAISAPEGRVCVVADLSGIELRVNHTLAGQASSVEAFREHRDLYCEFASMLYNEKITKENAFERQVGKLAHLSLGYGCGTEKFQEICRLKGVIITIEEAKKIVYLWREVYNNIEKMWHQAAVLLEYIYMGEVALLDNAGLVKTGKGGWDTVPHNRILYPGLQRNTEGDWGYMSRYGLVKLYGAKAIENICQHLARNIAAYHWLQIAKRYRIVLTRHDDFLCVVPEDEGQECLDFMLKTMHTSPPWWPEIPLAAEGGFNRVYGLAK